MSAPPQPPPGGPSEAAHDSKNASESGSQQQQVIDIFGADLGPAAFTLTLVVLNLMNGASLDSRDQ